jgi:hypothetical protein
MLLCYFKQSYKTVLWYYKSLNKILSSALEFTHILGYEIKPL